MKFLILFLFFYSIRISTMEFHYFVIWNVGQGLWQSYITPTKCYHFDMGGEQAPWSLIRSFCKGKTNTVRISHWDLDHYGFFKTFHRQFKTICFSDLEIPKKKIKFKWLLKKQKLCTPSELIFSSWRPSLKQKTNTHKHGSNALSEVILFKDLLMTGDSPKEMEAHWIDEFNLKGVNKLVVGHHGSNTSSSEKLLNTLKLQNKYFVGIVSARKKRYSHPHWDVKRRFQNIKAPLITTEKWGHIIYRY